MRAPRKKKTSSAGRKRRTTSSGGRAALQDPAVGRRRRVEAQEGRGSRWAKRWWIRRCGKSGRGWGGDCWDCSRSFETLVETLRLALQRERGSFSNFHGGTPIRPLTVVGSEVDAKLKGLDQRFKELRTKEKGALRPFVAVSGAA